MKQRAVPGRRTLGNRCQGQDLGGVAAVSAGVMLSLEELESLDDEAAHEALSEDEELSELLVLELSDQHEVDEVEALAPVWSGGGGVAVWSWAKVQAG